MLASHQEGSHCHLPGRGRPEQNLEKVCGALVLLAGVWSLAVALPGDARVAIAEPTLSL